MRSLLLLPMFAALAFGQAHDVHYQGVLTPLNITPTFDRGYVVAYDRDSSIDVFAPDGSLLFKTSAHGPDGSQARIHNAAMDVDGTLAAAVEYPLSCDAPGLGVRPGRAGAIALFNHSGLQIGFIDTGCDYWTTQVAFAADHSIWTLGYLGMATSTLKADYLTLRHYSQDGRQIGAFLPRASFPHPDDPQKEPLIMPITGLWELRVANGRVEVMLRRANLWVETDLNGNEIGRWETGPDARPNAFTQDGRAWRQAGKLLLVFDRASGKWNQAAIQVPEGHLIGADGNNLAFLMPETVRLVPAP